MKRNHRISITKSITACLEEGGKSPQRLSSVVLLLGLMVSAGTIQAGELHRAIEQERTDAVKQLLAAGADPNQINMCDLSPLRIAVGKNSALQLSLLIDAGADVNATDRQQLSTPLHLAAYLGDVKTLNTLLEHGANIDQQDISGYTPLIRAVYGGQEQTVITLLSRGADSSITDYILGKTATDIAQLIGRESIANIIKNSRSKT